MIKLEYLRYFQMAAEKKSFSAAANAFFISSTSIVHAVNQLEEHYGISLFVRKKSVGLTLTPDGEKLLQKSQNLLLEVEAIEDSFATSEQGIKGELVVGCQEGLTWSLLPRVIGHLEKKHPKLKVVMKTIWMEERFSALENGDVDVLVTFLVNQKPPKKFSSTLLCKPNTCALMRKGHPLDKGGALVSLEDLARFPQVMINDGDAHDLFYGMYEKLELSPDVMLKSNISTGAQAIVGRTDAVSLRILRPVNKFSPLGDPITCPEVSGVEESPDLVAITNKLRDQPRQTKHSVFLAELLAVFESGEMKAHIYY